MISPVDITRRIASYDLPSSRADDEPLSIDAEQNAQVLDLLRTHRLEGVGVEALAAGFLQVDPSFAAALVQLHDETMAQTLRIEITAVAVSELLTDHGITHRILKGVALAHEVAMNPAQRPFRDVDVLVRSSSIDDAVAMLEFEGALRLQPQLRQGFDARFAKSVTMSLKDVEIDLHRVLAPGPFGVWMRAQDLFLLGTTVHVGGVDLPTLDRTEHLLHACYHAALGSAEPALVNLRDIALLAIGEWDGERFGQMVDRWRGRAVVQRAVRLVEDTLGVDLPDELRRFRHDVVDADERRALEPYFVSDPRGRFAALAPSTLRALPMSDRAAFALAVGFPEGERPVARLRSLIDRVR